MEGHYTGKRHVQRGMKRFRRDEVWNVQWEAKSYWYLETNNNLRCWCFFCFSLKGWMHSPACPARCMHSPNWGLSGLGLCILGQMNVSVCSRRSARGCEVVLHLLHYRRSECQTDCQQHHAMWETLSGLLGGCFFQLKAHIFVFEHWRNQQRDKQLRWVPIHCGWL